MSTLTQDAKDKASTAAQGTVAAIGEFPNDVPEKPALLADANTLALQVDNLVIAPPPPPPGVEDPVLIYDGAFGITGTHLYRTLVPWKHPGGDWIDAAGVENGPKAFSEVTLKYGQASPFTVDVTALVKQNEETQIMIRGFATTASAPMFYIHSRESGVGPKLAVTYNDDSTDSIPVMYDTEANRTTAYELGNRTTYTVTYAVPVYLRFPALTQAVKTAVLVLDGAVNAAGKLQVFQFTQWRAPPATETFTLKGDPRIFFETQSFEKGTIPKYMEGRVWSTYALATGNVPDPYKQRATVDDGEGGKALQITFDPHLNPAFNATVCFPDFLEADEAAWEFDLRFMPDMITGMADGFKLFAGCSSSTKNDDVAYCNWAGVGSAGYGRMGTLLAGNGGAKSHGYDGWSHRFDCYNTPPAPHPLNGRFTLQQYTYWPGQADFYGDPWAWSLQNQSLVTNEWYTIGLRCKINSCTGTTYAKDAELDGYINQRLALRHRNYYLRTTDNPVIAQAPYNVKTKLAIGRIWLNTYHGGTLLPKARCSFQIRNFRAAKFA